MKKIDFDQEEQKKFKLILVGDSNVGKTSIFVRYMNGQYNQAKAQQVTTVDFKMKTVSINNELAKLYIWDTAGQEKYRSIVGTYFKGCHGAFIVFDMTKKQSFQHAAKDWYSLCTYRAPNCQIYLVGNKSDLCKKPSGDDNETVDKQEILDFCREKQIKFFEVSAKTGVNITRMFDEMVGQLLKKEISKSKSIVIDSKMINKKSECC